MRQVLLAAPARGVVLRVYVMDEHRELKVTSGAPNTYRFMDAPLAPPGAFSTLHESEHIYIHSYI